MVQLKKQPHSRFVSFSSTTTIPAARCLSPRTVLSFSPHRCPRCPAPLASARLPPEVSLMDEDIWQHFRHCPDIQRIISYFHDPTVKKANLGVAEQAYAHFLEAVSSETRKHYEFRAMYTDLAKLAPKHHPANIDPPTADFVFPELDTVETLPTLPLLDTAPHSSPPPVPQVKRPKLETGAQSSPATSAHRQPAPKPVRRPVPIKAAPRISLSPRSLPSLPRIARPVPSTSKPVKAPARPSLPTLPVEPDPDSEDDKSQDQEQDADADAEAEVDDDEEEEAQFTPEEDPEEEPAKPAPSKSKGKARRRLWKRPRRQRRARLGRCPRLPQRSVRLPSWSPLRSSLSSSAIRLWETPWVPKTASHPRCSPARSAMGPANKCFEEGRGLSCLPCKTKGIKCSHCLTGVAHMLLQQRAETFASGGASVPSPGRSLPSTRLRTHTTTSTSRSATSPLSSSKRRLALRLRSWRSTFEDPNDLAVVQGVLKRLQVSRVQAFDEFHTRPRISERSGAPPSSDGSPALQRRARFLGCAANGSTPPRLYTGASGAIRGFSPNRAVPMPLTPANDPELFAALRAEVPAPPRTPPMASLDGPEEPAPATPPRAPPSFSLRDPAPSNDAWSGFLGWSRPTAASGVFGIPVLPGLPTSWRVWSPGRLGGTMWVRRRQGNLCPGSISAVGASDHRALAFASPAAFATAASRSSEALPVAEATMAQLAPATFEDTAGTGEASGA
ncbi:hypothetical protein B0H15DRAFT_807296 [Mycena belliarum]|uniref:Uncharacterized protein n=1 Tax=Mycena belliarum TaxID=1033014 RepID=A0AAD6TML7_9AGAR|nr:hypothetical protein B0H15DRAFT_807296 [Mycena belliae]